MDNSLRILFVKEAFHLENLYSMVHVKVEYIFFIQRTDFSIGKATENGLYIFSKQCEDIYLQNNKKNNYD